MKFILVHALLFCFFKNILLVFFHVRLGRPSELFPSGFLSRTMYVFIFYPIHATCSTHPIFIDLITQMILGDEYKSWSSSIRVCCFPPSYPHCVVSILHQQQHTEKVEKERACGRNESHTSQLVGVGKTRTEEVSARRTCSFILWPDSINHQYLATQYPALCLLS